MNKPTRAGDMVPHLEHEMREFLRVARMIQSGEHSGTALDATLREAFASHFRKLCEFFGVRRGRSGDKDVHASDYGVEGLWQETETKIQDRLADADKLQAHVSGGRKEREGMDLEWGEKHDIDLIVPMISRFLKEAKKADWDFPKARQELKDFGS